MWCKSSSHIWYLQTKQSIATQVCGKKHSNKIERQATNYMWIHNMLANRGIHASIAIPHTLARGLVFDKDAIYYCWLQNYYGLLYCTLPFSLKANDDTCKIAWMLNLISPCVFRLKHIISMPATVHIWYLGMPCLDWRRFDSMEKTQSTHWIQ